MLRFSAVAQGRRSVERWEVITLVAMPRGSDVWDEKMPASATVYGRTLRLSGAEPWRNDKINKIVPRMYVT